MKRKARLSPLTEKIIRGSGNESHKACHVVSAFVAENRMVSGELVTEEKSNEITAVPELPPSLNIEGSVVTADAMSCQKKTVEQIQNGGADYIIGLKGNQSALLENVSLYFESFSGWLPKLTTRLKDRERIEKREYRLLTDLSWMEETRIGKTSTLLAWRQRKLSETAKRPQTRDTLYLP